MSRFRSLVPLVMRRTNPLLMSSDVMCRGFKTSSPAPFFKLFGKKKKVVAEEVIPPPALSSDDLFHPLLTSPIPDVRTKGKLIHDHGVCPTCLDESPPQPTMISPAELIRSKRPNFTCPGCGMPTHCSENHYLQGKEHHSKYCSVLRQINEDEHDLRSGRTFPEFQFPQEVGPEAAINLTNWDTLFVTREFKNVDNERHARHVSKLLSYPITIASVLHPFGPHYKAFTKEGQRSMKAIHYAIDANNSPTNTKQVMRIFILGARAEGQLPPYAYLQLCYLFPNISFELHFIGPESMPPPGVPNKVPINPHLSFQYHTGLFHTLYHYAQPFDPFHDAFFLLHPGLAYPSTTPQWTDTLSLLLDTKCPIFLTGYDSQDISNDSEMLQSQFKDQFDWLLNPTINPFQSLKQDLNLQDVRMTLNANHSIMAIRGKRYEVISS